MRTTEELGRVFRRRLIKIFCISEEENEMFCEETEREVDNWIKNNEDKLERKRMVEIEDTPEITPELKKNT